MLLRLCSLRSLSLQGTALVLAFLQTAQLMDVLTLAEWRHAATEYFLDVSTPAGRSFDETTTTFVTLLSPGVLDGKAQWWPRVRFWKLILSQNTSVRAARIAHIPLAPANTQTPPVLVAGVLGRVRWRGVRVAGAPRLRGVKRQADALGARARAPCGRRQGRRGASC